MKKIYFLSNELYHYGGAHNLMENMASKLKSNNNNIHITLIGIEAFGNGNFNIENKIKNVDDFLLFKDNEDTIIKLIINTKDAIFISFHFGVHAKLQKYLTTENYRYLFFVGDSKYIKPDKQFKWHYNKLLKKEINNYDCLLTLSDVKPFKKIVPNGNKIIQVNNFINNIYQNLYSNSYNYVVVSRLENEKNIHAIIEIGKQLKKAKIFIYGLGTEENNLKEKIEKYNLTNNIIMMGYEKDKKKMYEKKSGLVIVSLSEGEPSVILEAYSFGIPVVSFNTFSNSSKFVSPGTGELVGTNDYNSIALILDKGIKFNKLQVEKKFKELNKDKWVLNLLTKYKWLIKLKKGVGFDVWK